MKPHKPKAAPRKDVKSPALDPPPPLITAETFFAALLGAFFGLCLLKFGNPAIMEKYVEAPRNGFELMAISPWPLSWAYMMLGGLTVFGALITTSYCRRRRKETLNSKGGGTAPVNGPRAVHWLLLLPLAWLCWQALATLTSISR